MSNLKILCLVLYYSTCYYYYLLLLLLLSLLLLSQQFLLFLVCLLLNDFVFTFSVYVTDVLEKNNFNSIPRKPLMHQYKQTLFALGSQNYESKIVFVLTKSKRHVQTYPRYVVCQ